MENFLWKTGVKKTAKRPLWKRLKFSTLGCAKKSVAALREIGLIHINFLYYCYYCIYISIYIFYEKEYRKEDLYAFYL